jgi:hypothetical protein
MGLAFPRVFGASFSKEGSAQRHSLGGYAEQLSGGRLRGLRPTDPTSIEWSESCPYDDLFSHMSLTTGVQENGRPNEKGRAGKG